MKTQRQLANLRLSENITSTPRLHAGITSSMENKKDLQVDTTENFYNIVLFVLFLDELLNNLESKFNEDSVRVYDLDVFEIYF